MKATLVITASGKIGEEIAYVADKHVAYDRQRRHIVRRGDAAYPRDEVIQSWGNGIVAVMLNEHDAPVMFLTRIYATSEARIEDAFVRAVRTVTAPEPVAQSLP